MASMNRILQMIGGFGAGVGGYGEEYHSNLSEGRKQAMMKDAFTIQRQIEAGDVDGARGVLQNRLAAIEDLGGDPSDSQGLLDKIDAGDISGAFTDVSTLVEYGRQTGQFKGLQAASQPKRSIVDGQVVSIGSDGSATASPVEGFQRSPGKQQDRDLRERAIAVSEATQRRQATKLSAGLENALIASQDRVVSAQRNANEYTVLAGDFERLNLEGGVKSSFSEGLKGILGTQDDVSEFRRRFNKVRLSEGLKNLPPGPATDRDVQEAFKGVPKDNASAEQVASFLRGAARLARFDAGYNQFKADFISTKSNVKGLNRSWRSQVSSPTLKRKVSIAEIYETAQNRGIPPEDVARQLGIDTGLF